MLVEMALFSPCVQLNYKPIFINTFFMKWNHNTDKAPLQLLF